MKKSKLRAKAKAKAKEEAEKIALESKNEVSNNTPRGADKDDPLKGQYITWRVGMMDQGGDFGWGSATSQLLWSEVWLRMEDFEKKTFAKLNKKTSPGTVF